MDKIINFDTYKKKTDTSPLEISDYRIAPQIAIFNCTREVEPNKTYVVPMIAFSKSDMYWEDIYGISCATIRHNEEDEDTPIVTLRIDVDKVLECITTEILKQRFVKIDDLQLSPYNLDAQSCKEMKDDGYLYIINGGDYNDIVFNRYSLTDEEALKSLEIFDTACRNKQVYITKSRFLETSPIIFRYDEDTASYILTSLTYRDLKNIEQPGLVMLS